MPLKLRIGVMASLLKIIQQKALAEIEDNQSENNPMWPQPLPPELLEKIAEYIPANLPVHDSARFELWKKGGTPMETIARAEDKWYPNGYNLLDSEGEPSDSRGDTLTILAECV